MGVGLVLCVCLYVLLVCFVGLCFAVSFLTGVVAMVFLQNLRKSVIVGL